MSFILTKERDEDPIAAFARYTAYLEEEKHRFPKNAFELATSDWYFSFNDHQAPHDAKLESVTISETRGALAETPPALSIIIKLLSAQHDGHIELKYFGVVRYAMGTPELRRGHGDWRYDEFRVSDSGHLIHEIEWWEWGMGSYTWMIEALDVQHSWHPI